MFLSENKTQKFSPHFGVQRIILALVVLPERRRCVDYVNATLDLTMPLAGG